jgi:integrase
MREVTGAMLWNELSWRPNRHRLGRSEVAARPVGLSSAPLRATCPCRPALDDSVHSVRSQPGTVDEALSLAERDLDPGRGALLVRNGKGGTRREVGMDEWGWEQLRPWLESRSRMPIGTLFCVINGPTCGRPWSGPAARTQLRRLALDAGVRRRFAPHQLRHAHAVEMAREGVPLNVIQRQLGHADLGVTSVYLQGIDHTEVISAVHSRRAPTMPASAGLLL